MNSGNNGQNQLLISINMTIAEKYTSIGQLHLAIATYTEVLRYDPYNGCALLGRADVYKKSAQLDLATKDEDIGNRLQHTCHTTVMNLLKPAQPSRPDLDPV